jgi:hypothetical protein
MCIYAFVGYLCGLDMAKFEDEFPTNAVWGNGYNRQDFQERGAANGENVKDKKLEKPTTGIRSSKDLKPHRVTMNPSSHGQDGTDTPMTPSVAELLSQLQASATFSIASSGFSSSPATSPSEHTSFDAPISSSVADLLSKLRAPLAHPIISSDQDTSTSSPLASVHAVAHAQRDVAVPIRKSTQDMKSLTFQQALPHLARLSENPEFVSTIAEVRLARNPLHRAR